jgi:hypothetical protein
MKKKEITLSNGLVTLVDDRDFKRVLAAGPWHARHSRHTTYAQRHICKPDGKKTTQQMHRFILGLTDPKILTDHQDRNGLHNWRENIRPATNSQNIANQRPRSDGGSSYRGVSYHKQRRKWCATIGVNRRHIHLGLFTDEVAAARAYDAAAREHFGGFANLNFPPKKPAVSDAALDVERAC